MVTIPISNSQQTTYTPARNSECLCGSGHRFKQCCADYLPVSDIGTKGRVAAKADDYKAALIAARSDITQYTIWHKAHTAPHIRVCHDELPKPFYERLLNIDVKALSECVDSLLWCYNQLNRTDELPAVLERLRLNIDHPLWHRKIIYFHALQLLGKNWDDEAGKKELKKLGSMDDETDTEILQLCLDLFHDELSFSTRQKLIGRIVDLTENPEERLHYQFLRAVSLLMVDDQKGATEKLQAAIHDYRSVRDEKDESAYGLTYYASACEMLGQIDKDRLLIDEAVTLFQQLVVREDLNIKGVANAYRNLGDALCSISSWEEAKEAYSAAFERAPDEILKVFISQCLLYLNNIEEAEQCLSTVEKTALTASETVDFAFTFSQVAIESGKNENLVSAEHELRTIEIAEPYFKQYKDELLISVIDRLRIGPSKERAAKTRGVIQKISYFFCRYAILKPNFMGIGININKIVEDGVEAHKVAPKKE